MKKDPSCNPRIVCYEKQATQGGLWNVTWKTGVDTNGETIHNSMYNNLWTNNSKESVELPTYSYDQHFGMTLPSFLPSYIMHDYLTGYYKFANGEKYTRFNTSVKNCEWLEDQKKFKMTVRDLVKGEDYVDYHTH